ncbi:hypothetical protein [Gordonia soli]|uniref:Holliday junction nuclease RuvC n=1 Tax=Gordonia soli NBRC 108243 TaxID=1223545 RepID=M0QQ53_9ACTN|nr:hypothetical protein [Gordonia soli]GAC70820.1 hypothetical protein GS4_41_00700 [Gordonia soli NBRC 108243]
MSHIVGLDPSLTSCGIAILGRDGDETVVRKLRSPGHRSVNAKDWRERWHRVVTQSRFVLQALPSDIDLVVVEDMPSHQKPQPALGDRWALWFGLCTELDARGIPVAVCNPATREKWATGKVVRGLSDDVRKARVTTAVREQWPGVQVANHDCADALTLAAMGALKLGWTLPFEIKDRHHEGLTHVAWPKEMRRA